jgi:hypothetical protein
VRIIVIPVLSFVKIVKLLSVFCHEAWVQVGSTGDGFFLSLSAVDESSAWLCCRGKIEYANLTLILRVVLERLEYESSTIEGGYFKDGSERWTR